MSSHFLRMYLLVYAIGFYRNGVMLTETVTVALIVIESTRAYINVATGKPAWQSSTLRHSSQAGYAVDGYEGDENLINCSSTKGYRRPAWWEVDLLTEFSIQKIVITPRPLKSSSGRLAGYSVLVSKTEKQNDFITCFEYGKNATLPNAMMVQEVQCITSLRGRYVMITQRRNDPPYPSGYSNRASLELCEVKVFVDSDQIATGKVATQSTTYRAFKANNSVDGDEGNIYMEGCSHTSNGQQTAWWLVDLEDSYLIQNIIITPRPLFTPHTRGRLAGFEVSVSELETEDYKICFRYGKTDILPDTREKQVISCYPPVPGRYVKVSNNRTSPPYGSGYSRYAFVNLCEVEVIAEELQSECPYNCASCNCTSCMKGFHGPLCQRKCTYCGGNGMCNKTSGECLQKFCKAGFYGVHCNMTCHKLCFGSICDFHSGICDLCPPHCISCGSLNRCNECEANWYGKHCNYRCINCGNSNCDKKGKCLSNYCRTGYFGESCNDVCSYNCSGDGSCNIETGKCNSCAEGFHGLNCDSNCPPTCKTCKSKFDCQQCHNGWYGATCALKCPPCSEDGSCDRVKGNCLSNSCKTGYYGENGTCRNVCPTTCGGDGSCDISTGHCTICSNGLWGRKCFLRCPSNCAGNGSCERWTKQCPKGCTHGHYGKNCELKCPVTCGGDGSCSQIEGRCFALTTSGFKKRNATIDSTVHTLFNASFFSIIGSAVGGLGSLMLVALIIALVIRWLLKRRRNKIRETYVCMAERTTNLTSAEGAYSEIQTTSHQQAIQSCHNTQTSQMDHIECSEHSDYDELNF